MRAQPPSGDGTGRPAHPWPAFVGMALGVAAALLCVVVGLVAAIDPYGFRAGPGRAPRPIMDIDARAMYPQLARSDRFDSAVFGTSTIRLLDPRDLGARLGGSFANLGLNAGTPWEQLQLARLFLRHHAAPKTLVMGLDRNWCEPDADRPGRTLTFRPFPTAFYDENGWNDWPELVSLRSIEIAIRVVMNRLGLMPERVRPDGYENFLPPDALYDAARAAAHIRAPEAAGTEPGPGRLPALAWLADFVRELPAATRLVLLLPPIHVAAQARPGSGAAAADLACKARIAMLAARPGTTIVDYRMPSALTRDGSRYWDKLHYRQPEAAGIVASLADAVSTGRDDPNGLYRTISGR